MYIRNNRCLLELVLLTSAAKKEGGKATLKKICAAQVAWLVLQELLLLPFSLLSGLCCSVPGAEGEQSWALATSADVSELGRKGLLPLSCLAR